MVSIYLLNMIFQDISKPILVLYDNLCHSFYHISCSLHSIDMSSFICFLLGNLTIILLSGCQTNSRLFHRFSSCFLLGANTLLGCVGLQYVLPLCTFWKSLLSSFYIVALLSFATPTTNHLLYPP